jgi:hypothetical protein
MISDDRLNCFMYDLPHKTPFPSVGRKIFLTDVVVPLLEK